MSLFLATTRGARMFQGIQNSSQKSPPTSPFKCITSPRHTKPQPEKLPYITFGMHKKTMCPAQRREKQQDSCPSQTKQQAEKQPTVTVGMHKKPGVQRTRNRETAAGAEPTTQAEKLCNVTFAIHKNNGSSPAQGNRSRIRAQAKQNSSQKNWLPSPLECIKNTGIQRAKQETAAGAEPKATKPQPEKPSNLTFGMHKKFMCPAYAEQGNSSGIHAQGIHCSPQGIQNRSPKNFEHHLWNA